jgi:endonuclease YncB( thermonuclease family)
MEPGITHIPKSFGVRFFNDDYDTHQIKIGSVTGDLILPGGDYIIYPQSTGIIEYGCIIHPWVDGKLQVSNVPSLVYVDDAVDKSKTIPTHADNNDVINDNNNFQTSYDVTNCGVCYIGTVTKIIDGDTIYVDGTAIRLSLVNTPEKRETGYDDATNFIIQSCPVGSSVLVDVDDILLSDGLGVNFAKITCGVVNVNESLMDNNLARMYTTFCTESEFMYESWATHDCKSEIPYHNTIDVTPNVITDVTILNHTIISNSTIAIKNITNDDSEIIYIIVMCIIIVICLILLFYKKNQSFQDKSFPNTIWLE